jgi:hypothetical protein
MLPRVGKLVFALLIIARKLEIHFILCAYQFMRAYWPVAFAGFMLSTQAVYKSMLSTAVKE